MGIFSEDYPGEHIELMHKRELEELQQANLVAEFRIHDKRARELKSRLDGISNVMGVAIQNAVKDAQNVLKVVTECDEPVVGDWQCAESPFDRCVYEDDVDPSHDNCIYCCEPEERK